MGTYLDKPVTDKFSTEGRNGRLSYGACTMQGWRRSHEDTFDCNTQLGDGVCMFAVYDGHGGRQVSIYCKEQLPLFIRKHWNYDDISKTLEDAILDLDEQIGQKPTNAELESIEIAFPEREMFHIDEFKEDDDEDEESEDHPNRPVGSEADKPISKEETLNDVVTGLVQSFIAKKRKLARGEEDVSSDTESDTGSETTAGSPNSAVFENDEIRTEIQQDTKEESYDAEEENTEESDSSSQEESDDSGREAVDEETSQHKGSVCGTTAVIALLTETHLYVANVGDSKCVLSRSGRAHEMTVDHKPTDASEMKRIIKAGGHVKSERINGSLAVSRALGIHMFKSKNLPPHERIVSAVPDVKVVEMNPETDEFIFLATDGVWDVLTPEKATEFVRQRLGSMSLSAICEEMFNTIMPTAKPKDEIGLDNMTCIIIKPNFPVQPNSSEVSTAEKRHFSEQSQDEAISTRKRFKKAA